MGAALRESVFLFMGRSFGRYLGCAVGLQHMGYGIAAGTVYAKAAAGRTGRTGEEKKYLAWCPVLGMPGVKLRAVGGIPVFTGLGRPDECVAWQGNCGGAFGCGRADGACGAPRDFLLHAAGGGIFAGCPCRQISSGERFCQIRGFCHLFSEYIERAD